MQSECSFSNHISIRIVCIIQGNHHETFDDNYKLLEKEIAKGLSAESSRLSCTILRAKLHDLIHLRASYSDSISIPLACTFMASYEANISVYFWNCEIIFNEMVCIHSLPSRCRHDNNKCH